MTATVSAPQTSAPAATRLELVAAVEAEARGAGRHDLADRLATERVRALDPSCTVLIVGEFKKGKSRLVNALLNAPLCPVDADIATAVPTALRYGSAPRVTVRTGDTAAEVPLESVPAYVRQEGEPAETVEIEVPRQLLASGLVVVDTPGVGGGLSSAHAAATLRALTRADAVVFVSDASQEYTAPELAFLRQVHSSCDTVLCVLTKTDFYPEWRRIVELNTAHLHRAGLELELVPLSAPLRQEGLRTGDRQLLQQSGYPRLAAFLRQQAVARTEDVLATAALAEARTALGQLMSGVAAERQATGDRESSASLLQRLEQAKADADRLRGGAARWQQMLNDRIADMVSNVDLDLARRVRAVRREAAERINSSDPALAWGELEAWVYTTSNEQVLAHYREMRSEAELVIQEVGRQYGIAVGDLTRALELPGTAGLEQVVLGPLVTERSSWFERTLIGARSGSGGALITHAAATALNVAFPVALPVTLPATALLAAILARKAVKGTKESELRASRVDAVRAVNSYLDDAELLARKDSRDTLRRISQGLREHFTERAAELHASAVHNLEAVARSIQADRETAAQQRDRLDAELARMRELLTRIDTALAGAS